LKKIIFVVLVTDEKNRIGKPLVRIRESGFVVNVTGSTTLEPMEAVAFKVLSQSLTSGLAFSW
jgi:hypothetical protein